jgi:hypothetical protein
VAGNPYTYDGNGNLISGGGRTPQWNVDNQPTLISGTQFLYDGLGERVKKTSAQGTSLYPFGDDYEVTNGDEVHLGRGARGGGQTPLVHVLFGLHRRSGADALRLVALGWGNARRVAALAGESPCPGDPAGHTARRVRAGRRQLRGEPGDAAGGATEAEEEGREEKERETPGLAD